MSSGPGARTAVVLCGVGVLALASLLAGCGNGRGTDVYHPESTPPLARSEPLTETPASPSTTPTPSKSTAPATATATPTGKESKDLGPVKVVVVGDSVGAQSPPDCRGCPTFGELYAASLTRSLGRKVSVDNLARGDHTRVAGLRRQVRADARLRGSLADADVVVVSVGFYDGPPWPPGQPCGRSFATAEQQLDIVASYPPRCVRANLRAYRGSLGSLYSAIARLAVRPGAVKLALNTYNNWPGHPTLLRAPANLSGRGIAASIRIYNQWNPMQCAAATRSGFTCVDVYHKFNGPTGREAAGALLTPTRVDPSARGQKVIAGILARAPRPTT